MQFIMKCAFIKQCYKYVAKAKTISHKNHIWPWHDVINHSDCLFANSVVVSYRFILKYTTYV